MGHNFEYYRNRNYEVAYRVISRKHITSILVKFVTVLHGLTFTVAS